MPPAAQDILDLPLTTPQRRLLEYIAFRLRTDGFAPSLEEMSGHMGFSGPWSCGCHLLALERKGYIARTPRQSRSIRILRRPDGSKP